MNLGVLGDRMDMAASFFEFLHVNKHKVSSQSGIPCTANNNSCQLQTFRPKKKFPVGTLRYNLHKAAEATLHSGVDLRSAVRLPPGESIDDWLAVHSGPFLFITFY